MHGAWILLAAALSLRVSFPKRHNINEVHVIQNICKKCHAV